MIKFKIFFLLFVMLVSLSFSFSWGAGDQEQVNIEVIEIKKEMGKEDFFALHNDIIISQPVPRPSGVGFSMEEFELEKLENLKTYAIEALEKNDFYIFHGVNPHEFNEHNFKELYGQYINCENWTIPKMMFAGLWSNVCVSGSLIHPTKSPTWAPQGVLLKVPYQLIFLASYEDNARLTHSKFQDMYLKKKNQQESQDYVDMHFDRKNSLIQSADDCFRNTLHSWHNEIQFVPEAIVDGIEYSVKVVGFWVRDKSEETISYRKTINGLKLRSYKASVTSADNLRLFEDLSKELNLPLILSSEWEK